MAKSGGSMKNILIVTALILSGCAVPNSDTQGLSSNGPANQSAAGVVSKTSDALQNLASELQKNSGWSVETRNSAVTGKQYLAKFRDEVPGRESFYQQIEIRCGEESRELSTTLTIVTDGSSDEQPEFMFFETGGRRLVTGARRVAGTDHAISFSGAELSRFTNQAFVIARVDSESKQGTFELGDDRAKRFASALPMALDLESNLGTIEFIIPRTEGILDVVKKCEIPSQETEAVVPAQIEPASTPAVPQASVLSVDLGSAIGVDNKVTVYSSHFIISDAIHASVATDGVGGKLNAKWTYQDGQTVVSQDKDVMAGPQATDFSISKPDGWPVGRYKVYISLDENVVQTRDFEVN